MEEKEFPCLLRYGFSSREITQFLGEQDPAKTHPKLLFQFKDHSVNYSLSKGEFLMKFGVAFMPTLFFSSSQELEEVLQNCPYLLKYEWLLGSGSQLENRYCEAAKRGDFADVCVKWIDPVKGYGLFATSEIGAHSFVGEYTGLVREVNRKDPQLNPYCFHYPTRFWSRRPTVIDAKHEGNLARFINHSDKPNLQPLWIVDRSLLRLIFFANQCIQQGTELTFNYGVHCFEDST